VLDEVCDVGRGTFLAKVDIKQACRIAQSTQKTAYYWGWSGKDRFLSTQLFHLGYVQIQK